MKNSTALSLSLRFLLSKKIQFFFVFLGISLGTALFFVFISVGNGISYSLKNVLAPDSEITSLQPNPGSEQQLDFELIEVLYESPFIGSVHSESTQVLPFTFSISLPWMDDILLDLYFLRGIDTSLFSPSDTPFQMPEGFTGDKDEVIPVVLNPLSLDLINSLLSGFLGEVNLSADAFLGREVSVILGSSTFLPGMNHSLSVEKTFVVTGFSPLAPLVGVMMPMQNYDRIRAELGFSPSGFSRLHVFLTEGSVLSDIDTILSSHNLVVLDREKSSAKLFQMVDVINGILLFSSTSIIFLSLLFLFSVLQIVLKEHQKNIGILQAMGASQKTIWKIFGMQGVFVVGISVFFGILLGVVLLSFLQWWWTHFISMNLFPPSIFEIDYMLGGVLALVIFVFSFFPLFFALRAPLKKPVLFNILGL